MLQPTDCSHARLSMEHGPSRDPSPGPSRLGGDVVCLKRVDVCHDFRFVSPKETYVVSQKETYAR